MSVTFRPAKRENVSLILGIAGPSGSGKTFSAMRLAAGIVGPGNRFAVIDTEAGRAKHYADQFAFDHCDLLPPFRPDSYADAIKTADDAGYKAIVVDSMSHEWAGEGGILDWQDEELTRMAGDDYRKREQCKMAAWIRPKMAHKQTVQRLLQVRAHLILCFRAEEKIEMVRDPKTQKMEIQKKLGTTGLHGWFPICEKGLPYELTVSFLMLPERPGVGLPLKLQEQHKAMFPSGKPIDEASGALVRSWADGGAAPAPPEPDGLRVGLMGESTILNWCSNMEEAATSEQLARNYANAMIACKKLNDGVAQKRILAARDKRKDELAK